MKPNRTVFVGLDLYYSQEFVDDRNKEIERLENIIKGLDNTIENLEEVVEYKDNIIKKLESV